MTKETFNTWMVKVDKAVSAIAGVSVYDLPDQNFYDQWEDALSPRQAARDALIDAGWDVTFTTYDITATK